MIASLPMYDRPHLAGANGRLWDLIRDRLRAAGVEAPEGLMHGEADPWRHWEAPDLVFSQTCGLPYRTQLHDRVTLIGTPDYGLKGCPPGYYQSVIIARSDDPRNALADFRGARFAYNDGRSQSGWAALANLAPEVLTGPMVKTGGHFNSAMAVREGRADFAAIDAVTWSLMRADWAASELRIIHATPPTPGLPFITAAGNDADLFFGCVSAAIAALPSYDRDDLGLRGLVRIPAADYLAIPTPPPPK